MTRKVSHARTGWLVVLMAGHWGNKRRNKPDKKLNMSHGQPIHCPLASERNIKTRLRNLIFHAKAGNHPVNPPTSDTLIKLTFSLSYEQLSSDSDFLLP